MPPPSAPPQAGAAADTKAPRTGRPTARFFPEAGACSETERGRRHRHSSGRRCRTGKSLAADRETRSRRDPESKPPLLFGLWLPRFGRGRSRAADCVRAPAQSLRDATVSPNRAAATRRASIWNRLERFEQVVGLGAHQRRTPARSLTE